MNRETNENSLVSLIFHLHTRIALFHFFSYHSTHAFTLSSFLSVHSHSVYLVSSAASFASLFQCPCPPTAMYDCLSLVEAMIVRTRDVEALPFLISNTRSYPTHQNGSGQSLPLPECKSTLREPRVPLIKNQLIIPLRHMYEATQIHCHPCIYVYLSYNMQLTTCK